jgi:G6PDH family F420-dependent oxidoreductase
MAEIGYALSSEEHPPLDLVRHAARAEQVGFSFALISDHFHPWVSRQGNSPFAWSVIGGISQVTKQLRLGTGVTCPILRYPPPLIAQAAATAACMLPGRFFLGVGTGERLNEHILGAHWPAQSVRLEMLEEAVRIIRDLWKGDVSSHHGEYFTVEDAKIYTLPQQPPPIYVAASGEDAAKAAGRIGDGFISTSPDKTLVETFRSAGGSGKPCIGQLTVCYAADPAQARRTAYEWWPEAALTGPESTELLDPPQFDQAVKVVTEDQVAKAIVCGPDPQPHIQRIQQYVEAGFDHVYVHQVGPDQEGFFTFYAQHVLPHFRGSSTRGSRAA